MKKDKDKDKDKDIPCELNDPLTQAHNVCLFFHLDACRVEEEDLLLLCALLGAQPQVEDEEVGEGRWIVHDDGGAGGIGGDRKGGEGFSNW